MEVMNQVRGYHFMLGVLMNQESGPFCRGCNAFRNTLAAVRDSLEAFQAQQAGEFRQLPPEFARLFAETVQGIQAIEAPGDTVGQKKAGNCKLPEGHCFIKTSFAFLQRI